MNFKNIGKLSSNFMPIHSQTLVQHKFSSELQKCQLVCLVEAVFTSMIHSHLVLS